MNDLFNEDTLKQVSYFCAIVIVLSLAVVTASLAIHAVAGLWGVLG